MLKMVCVRSFHQCKVVNITGGIYLITLSAPQDVTNVGTTLR